MNAFLPLCFETEIRPGISVRTAIPSEAPNDQMIRSLGTMIREIRNKYESVFFGIPVNLSETQWRKSSLSRAFPGID